MAVICKFPRRRKKQIPAWIGFQATAGDNTLHLRGQTGGYDCTIDWGDGSKTTAPVNGGNVIHNYASAGLYDIKISGNSFAGFYINNQAGKEKYVAAYAMGKWAVDTMVNLENCFLGCKNLKIISIDLLKYNIKVQSFSRTFFECSGLTTIPNDLFKYNVKTTNFAQCFVGCSSLIEIPIDVFKYNLLVTRFDYCFQGCASLTKLPSNLFRYNPDIKSIVGCFYKCTKLTIVPADLLQYITKADSFSNFFADCSSLTTIPKDLFRYNIAVVDFRACFKVCNNLKIRDDIFGTDYANRFNGKTVNFIDTFYRESFSGAQGTAPALWNFTGLTATKINCFGGNGNNANSISNYGSIPIEWGREIGGP